MNSYLGNRKHGTMQRFQFSHSLDFRRIAFEIGFAFEIDVRLILIS